jgi:hypothetical protein
VQRFMLLLLLPVGSLIPLAGPPAAADDGLLPAATSAAAVPDGCSIANGVTRDRPPLLLLLPLLL